MQKYCVSVTQLYSLHSVAVRVHFAALDAQDLQFIAAYGHWWIV